MRRLLLVAVCCALAGGSAGAVDLPPAPTVFVSPAGNDSGPCTKAQPCASFDRAYHLARPGDVVELAGGTYPPQTVNVDPSKVAAAADVVLRPAAGASVTIDGDLHVRGSHLVVRDLKLHLLWSDAVRGANTSNHVTFQNLDGAGFLVGPNRDITIKGGDWGPNTGPGTQENKVGPDGDIPGQWPQNIVLDGLLIHDQNSTDLSNEHMGGLFLVSGGPLTLRNSRFRGNVVYDVQVQDFTSPECCGMSFGPVHDMLIEGNVFEHPVTSIPEGAQNDRQPELQLDPRHGSCWSNWTIRRNSFENGLALGLDGPPCFSRVTVSGNVGGAIGVDCFPGAAGLTWDRNLWRKPCGATDGTVPYGYAFDGAALQPAGATATAVRRVFTRAAASRTTLAQVVAGLRRELGRSWTKTRVLAILQDDTYRGGRIGPPGVQPALVDAKTWVASRKALRR